MPDCQAETSSSFAHQGDSAAYQLEIKLDTPGHKLKITAETRLCEAHKALLRTINLSGSVRVT